jgi:superoxide dismutase, Cu-Zn family
MEGTIIMTASCARIALLALPIFLVGLPAAAQTANAHLRTTAGEEVGVVAFAPLASGALHITISAVGLPPGVRGFHVHEVGECDPADEFESAGGHFNPTDADHGWDSPDEPHAGDLPNLHIHEDGTVAAEFFTTLLSLEEGDEATLIGGDGTSVIIHEHADDYSTDPTGQAGGRIACGVIELD